VRAYPIVVSLAAMLVAVSATGVGAQSPSPMPVASPPAVTSSGAPAASGSPGTAGELTCEDLAGLLPRSLHAWPLIWSAAEGAAEPVPGYPVADLAASLGITPADVCTVTFEYGSTMNGTIVRFRGAEQAGLLDAYIQDASATYLTKGYQLLTQPVDLGGRPGIELARDGFDRAAWQVGDMIVELPTGFAAEVAPRMPSLDAALPQVTPPPPGATEPPKVRNSCVKLSGSVSYSGREQFSENIAIGPDVIDRTGTLEDPGTSPAIMTDGLLDKLGIGPWDVCLVEIFVGQTGFGHLWRLGKGGPGTMEAYLDDVTTTVEAAGGTVVRGTEKVGKKDVTTLTVTLPAGVTTYYYYNVADKTFAEMRSKDNAKTIIPLIHAPRK
jgi:hypothetical protein